MIDIKALPLNICIHMKLDLTSIKTRRKIEPDYFRDYIQFNFEKLNERKVSFAKLKNEEINESLVHDSIIEQIYFEEELHLASYYYHSTIVSLYSWLESVMIEICDTIVRQTGFAFSLNDMQNRNITENAKKFISKLTDIEFELADKQWHAITLFQKIRNLIVHNNSQIDKEKVPNEVVKIIRLYGTINEQRCPSPFYINDVEVLYRLLNTAELYIEYIVSQLEDMEFKPFDKGSRPEPNLDLLPF